MGIIFVIGIYILFSVLYIKKDLGKKCETKLYIKGYTWNKKKRILYNSRSQFLTHRDHSFTPILNLSISVAEYFFLFLMHV